MEITGTRNSMDINIKNSWRHGSEAPTDKTTTPVKQLASRKDQNEE